MTRFRITVRGVNMELRGYVDGIDAAEALADAVKATGAMVMASPADDDYNPFFIQGIPTESVWEMQAQVIQGERALREKAEAELRDRELHHFETEQILEKIKAARSNGPECAVHPGDDEIICGWKMIVKDIDKALAAS